MKNYIYIEKVTTLKKIAGNFFLLLGIIGLIFTHIKLNPLLFIFWIVTCYVGIFFISTEGIEIDYTNSRCRKILSMYGVKYGLEWSTYPRIKYIALVETRMKQTFGGRGLNSTATTTISEKIVKINLFDINDKYQTIYFASNRNEALIISENINRFYNVEILTNFN